MARVFRTGGAPNLHDCAGVGTGDRTRWGGEQIATSQDCKQSSADRDASSRSSSIWRGCRLPCENKEVDTSNDADPARNVLRLGRRAVGGQGSSRPCAQVARSIHSRFAGIVRFGRSASRDLQALVPLRPRGFSLFEECGDALAKIRGLARFGVCLHRGGGEGCSRATAYSARPSGQLGTRADCEVGCWREQQFGERLHVCGQTPPAPRLRSPGRGDRLPLRRRACPVSSRSRLRLSPICSVSVGRDDRGDKADPRLGITSNFAVGTASVKSQSVARSGSSGDCSAMHGRDGWGSAARTRCRERAWRFPLCIGLVLGGGFVAAPSCNAVKVEAGTEGRPGCSRRMSTRDSTGGCCERGEQLQQPSPGVMAFLRSGRVNVIVLSPPSSVARIVV